MFKCFFFFTIIICNYDYKKEQEDIDKQKYSRGVTDKNQANEYNTGIDLIQKTIALRKELLQLEAEGQVKVGTGANGAPAWEYIGNGQAGSHIQELLKQANKLPVTEQQLTAAINNASVSENQRLKLAAELSRKNAKETVYLLDEPTTGLHLKDIQILWNLLRRLSARGDTVIVIEHHPDIIRLADWKVELGPVGGGNGGHLLQMGSNV